MNTMTFEEFKAMCHAACRERQACKEGFAQMLRADTPTMLLRAWVDNWSDVWKDRYADMLAGNVEALYAQYRREFHDVGLWVNEPSGRGKVLVTGGIVSVGGTARAFVVGKSDVHGYGNSIVYNHAAKDAVVTLHDYAYGYIEAGHVVARDQSHVQVSGDGVQAECYGRSEVFMTAGTLTDHGHHSIEAYGERAVVKGCVTRRITLADGARMLREITNKE